MFGCLNVSPLNPVLQEWQPQSYALLPQWGFPADTRKYGPCNHDVWFAQTSLGINF